MWDFKKNGHRVEILLKNTRISSLSKLDGLDSTFLITDLDSFHIALELLAQTATHVGIDTERACGYTYQDELCLLQIWHPQGIFLFDTLALNQQWDATVQTGNTAPGSLLSQVLADKIWILHSAVDDLPVLNDWGMFAKQIYDTRLAADYLNFSRSNLGVLIHHFLGIELSKAHQQENWARRPLPQSWLKYAADDVKYLFPLYQATAQVLEENGKLSWLLDHCSQILYQKYPTNSPITWENTSGISSLKSPLNIQALKYLFNQRDLLAQSKNIAVGRVLPRKTMLKLAGLFPQTWNQYLKFCREEHVHPRYWKEFWKALSLARTRLYSHNKSSISKSSPQIDPDVKAYFTQRKAASVPKPRSLTAKQNAYLECLSSFVALQSEKLAIKPHLLLTSKQAKTLVTMDFSKDYSLSSPGLPKKSSTAPSQNDTFASVTKDYSPDIPLMPALKALGLRPWALEIFLPLEKPWQKISKKYP